MERKFEFEFAGRQLTVEIGKLAQFANGSCLVRYGETAILSTATASNSPRRNRLFSASVDYEEKQYAAGKNTRRVY